MAVNVKLNRAGMAELLKSSGVRSSLDAPAAAAAAKMRGGAPRNTGALAASVTVWDDTTDRAVKRVGSRLDYALVVEARTGFMARSL